MLKMMKMEEKAKDEDLSATLRGSQKPALSNPRGSVMVTAADIKDKMRLTLAN